MNRMQSIWTRSLVVSLACAALVAFAPALAQEAVPAGEAPAAQPQERSREQVNSAEEPRRDGRGVVDVPSPPRGEVDGGEDADPPPAPPQGDAAEWERAMTFMKEHSPKRWALLPELPDWLQQSAQDWMFMRYRQLERWKSLDKEMYEINMRRLALQDELWAARWAVRFNNQVLSPEALSKVREQVTAYVDLNLEERELRVQRLRDVLRREETLLAAEKARSDAMVAESLARIERGGFSSGGPDGSSGGERGPRPQ